MATAKAKATEPPTLEALKEGNQLLLETLRDLAASLIEAEFPQLHLDSLEVVFRARGQNSFELKQRHGKILLTLALPLAGAKEFPSLVRRAARTAETLDQRRVYIPAKILAKLFENVTLTEGEKTEVSRILYGEKVDPATVKAASDSAADAAREHYEQALALDAAKLDTVTRAIAATAPEDSNA